MKNLSLKYSYPVNLANPLNPDQDVKKIIT